MSEDVKTKYYRLTKPEYHDAVKAITGFTGFDFVNNISDGRPYFPVVSGKYPTLAYIKLKEAGVIDLWFEEVDLLKESQFRKGDWIELDNKDATRKLVGLITNVSIKEDPFKDKYITYELQFPFEDHIVISRAEVVIATKNPCRLRNSEIERRFKSEMKRRGYFDKVYIDHYGQDSAFYIGEGLSDIMDVNVEKLIGENNTIIVSWNFKGIIITYQIWSKLRGWTNIVKKYEEPEPEKEFKYKVGDFVVCNRNLEFFDQKTFVGYITECRISEYGKAVCTIMPVNFKPYGYASWDQGALTRTQSSILRLATYSDVLEAFDQEARDRNLYPEGKYEPIAKYWPSLTSPTFEVSRRNPMLGMRQYYILWHKNSGWITENPFQDFIKPEDPKEDESPCSDCDVEDCPSRDKLDDDKVIDAFKTLLNWLDEN